MKKRQNLSSNYLSVFCLELSYILQSGLPLTHGLSLLKDNDNSSWSRALITEIYEYIELGQPLSSALQETGRFPDYMIKMIELSERTGRMELTLTALSKYYDQQKQFQASIQQAFFYPSVLLLVFLVVVSVIVTKVLPVFDEIFNQMELAMTPSVQKLMSLGIAFSGAATLIAVIGGLLLFIVLIIRLVPQARGEIISMLYYKLGASGLWGSLVQARFASGLYIAISSGLELGQCLESAGALVQGAQKMDERIADCKAILAREGNLAVALSDSGIFSPINSRMLTLGFETGNMDDAMRTIAENIEKSAQARLTGIVSTIEPIIVISMSIAAGTILLAVLFPLMNIML